MKDIEGLLHKENRPMLYCEIHQALIWHYNMATIRQAVSQLRAAGIARESIDSDGKLKVWLEK